jgi:N utilization substance protein A
MQTPRTEFAQALRAIATERGLDPDVIIDAVKQAIIAAYKRDAKDKGEDVDLMGFDVEINPGNGEARVFSWPIPAPKEEEEGIVATPPPAKPEDRKDVTPPGFGRIAAQIAKQVIHQKIREAEKGVIMDEFSLRVGGLISGMILRFDGPDVRVDLGRTEGIMPADERVPNEKLNSNQRLTFLLKDIIETPRGKQIILSRADSAFVEKLFEREVPEIGSGSVEIKATSREAGVRTKIAVSSKQSGVDPVGSCVGQKGVRVQAVTNELGGERVDIVPYNEDVGEFIKAALLPAEGLSVTLKKKESLAIVEAPEEQLSLAIGRDGQNARLAAKLTGWKIEIESLKEAKKPSIDKSSKSKKDEGKTKAKTSKKAGSYKSKAKSTKSKKDKS